MEKKKSLTMRPAHVTGAEIPTNDPWAGGRLVQAQNQTSKHTRTHMTETIHTHIPKVTTGIHMSEILLSIQ